jgi:hypothetical protein
MQNSETGTASIYKCCSEKTSLLHPCGVTIDISWVDYPYTILVSFLVLKTLFPKIYIDVISHLQILNIQLLMLKTCIRYVAGTEIHNEQSFNQHVPDPAKFSNNYHLLNEI